MKGKDAHWRNVIESKYRLVNGEWIPRPSMNMKGNGPWKYVHKDCSIAKNWKIVVGNGKNTRFWEDIWAGDRNLISSLPCMFNLAMHKEYFVDQC